MSDTEVKEIAERQRRLGKPLRPMTVPATTRWRNWPIVLYVATSDEVNSEISAKAAKADGTAVGPEITLKVPP